MALIPPRYLNAVVSLKTTGQSFQHVGTGFLYAQPPPEGQGHTPYRGYLVKSEQRQAIKALHRMRQQFVKFGTAQINGLRGPLIEYGEVMPKGRAGISRTIAPALERVAERLPAIVIDTLREQRARVGQPGREIGEIERRIGAWHRRAEALEDHKALLLSHLDEEHMIYDHEFCQALLLGPVDVLTQERVQGFPCEDLSES